MTDDSQLPAQLPEVHHLVVRSPVPEAKDYRDYRETLRYDFFSCCAYCSMSECEALARRFEIDHYEPVSARPDLEKKYDNLMYSCEECNSRKGDICPPPEARENGFRFFRPDQDIRPDHFELSGIRIEPKSQPGDFSIESLDLNRQSPRRIREIRKRLFECDRHVAHGIMALRKISIDRLPVGLKGRASAAMRQMLAAGEDIPEMIDELLRQHSKSPLIDPDPETAERNQRRNENLKQNEALYPGNWRGRKTK